MHAADTLIQQLQAGDTAAFEALFRQYWKPLYLAAYKRLHNREEAEDMVQEVLASVWQRRKGLTTGPGSSLSGYLFTALRYRIISFYAEMKPERFYGEVLEKLLLLQADDQYGLLLSDELRALLLREMSFMPDNMRQAYQLTRMEDHSVKETAAMLQLSEQTVKNLASASGKRLRKIVEEYYKGQTSQALGMITILILDRFR
jgi:RNA polymerase sigma factor (sigma-70 family)